MNLANSIPVQWLPYELLAEIFFCYLREEWYPFLPPKLPAPLLLGQVCSTWRRVVYGTPELWIKFALHCNLNKVENENVDHVSFTREWLSRAQLLPLSVSLRVDGQKTSNTRLIHILNAILPSAGQLRYFQAHLPFSYLMPLVDVPAGSMTLLEEVQISFDSPDQRNHPWAKNITAFMTAPRLRSVSLCSIDLLHCSIPFPWSQLTKLCINQAYPDTCLDIFLRCTNLIECALSMFSWEFENIHMWNAPIIAFPHLRSLELTIDGPIDRSGHSLLFFRPLKLPVLKELTLAMLDSCAWSQQIFMDFTMRSSLDLKYLCLNQVAINSRELLQLLEHMHSLVTLDIEHCQCLDNNLCDALCYRGVDGQTLVPKLQYLDFLDNDWDVDDNILADMIESRWWTDDIPRAVTRLEAVTLTLNNREIDGRVEERLERCRQEGLSLDLF